MTELLPTMLNIKAMSDSFELSPSQIALLQLVRLGIGNSSDSDYLLSDINWDNVYRMSVNQGVVAIVADGIQRLYDNPSITDISLDLPENEQLRYEWFGQSFSLEHRYHEYETAIAHLSDFYHSKGIPMMILKGYGLSVNYPIPSHRPCGDVDVWLFGKQKEADEFLMKECGIRAIKSSHHTVFSFEGEEIENHISFFETDINMGWKSEEVVNSLMNETLHNISIQGRQVLVPSPNLNAFFILKHSSGHFATDTISVRHILDWAFFVEHNYQKINWELLYRNARKRNIHIFLDCQNSICCKYLGFDTNHFPVHNEYPHYEARIIADILRSREPSKVPSLKDHFVKYCLCKAKRNIDNRWKYKITHTESFWVIFFRAARNRILHPYSYAQLRERYNTK